MTDKKCKYCHELLINLVGTSQTCLKRNAIVHMEDKGCADFEFDPKRYDRITECENGMWPEKNKRFRLSVSPRDSYDILDNVESEKKNAICIYNDLGCVPFSSAPALCDLLNELDDKYVELKKENELFFKKVFDILLKYQDLFNREMADEVLEELGIELTRWFD